MSNLRISSCKHWFSGFIAVLLLPFLNDAMAQPDQLQSGNQKHEVQTQETQPDPGWYFYDFFMFVEFEEGFEELNMSRIEVAPNGNIWAIGGGKTTDDDYAGILFRFDQEEWEVIDRFEIGSADPAAARTLPLYIASNENVYYSDGYNLRRYHNGSVVEYLPEDTGLPEPEYEDERLVDIIRDDDHVNWLLFSSPRVASFENPSEDYEVYNHENSSLPEPVEEASGIGTDYPTRHFALTGDTLWITTHRDHDGLIKKHDGEWEVYTTENSDLPGDLVTSLVADPDGALWVSTHPGESGEGALAQLKDEQWQIYNTASGLPSPYSKILNWEEGGHIWAVFGNGDDPGYGYLAEFDGDEWSVRAQEDEFFRYLASVAVDDHHNKWLAGDFNVINGGVGSLNQIYVELTAAPDPELYHEAGTEASLNWSAGDRIETISISYSFDFGDNWEVLETAREVDETPYNFNLPTPEEREGELLVKISSDQFGYATDISDTLTVFDPDKPFYHLRSKNFDGTYELYDPEIHGWSMNNSDSEEVWLEEKWQHIEYEGPLARWPFSGEPHHFPSFDALTRAFGEDDTIAGYTWHFNNIIPTLRASVLWPILTGMGYNGVCHGYAVTSLIGFTDGNSALSAPIDEDHLFDQQPNNDIRKMLNETWARQWSRDHFIENFLNSLSDNLIENLAERIMNNQSVTLEDILETDLVLAPPSQTLEDIKEMLDTEVNSRYPRALLMFPEGDFMGSHSVVAYKVEQSESNPDIWKIFIHDSNHPTKHDLYIEVDTDKDYYYYDDPTEENTFFGNNGLFLSDRVDGYRTQSTILRETESGEDDDPRSELAGLEDIGYMYSLFGPDADVRITDELGNSASLEEGVTSRDIPGSFPIVPLVGGAHDPIGFFMADLEYDIELEYPNGGIGEFKAFSADTVYRYINRDGAEGTTDQLRYGNSLSVFGNDQQFDMEVYEFNGSEERLFGLRDMTLAEDEQIEFRLENGGDLIIANHGSSGRFDLELRTDYAEEGYFLSENVQLDESSGYKLEVDSWEDLENQQVTLWVDSNMDGRYDRSETLESVPTSAESEEGSTDIPDEYGLHDNYPNPFNAVTTIGFSLPEAARVQLEVYNMLGQKIKTIAEGSYEAGRHEVSFDAGDMATGTYIYRIRAGSFTDSGQMMLIK